MGGGLNLASGRVIAVGRLLLATLFVIVAALDPATPDWPSPVDGLLLGYFLFAVALVAVTWRNLWLDASLGGPAQAIDIIMFTALVLMTEGDRSPFFPFFVFVLLAAAIRWGWRATALTAVLLALLYGIATVVSVSPGNPFEPERFAGQLGHLVILSMILIWFAMNQWGVRLSGTAPAIPTESPPTLPTVESALSWAMRTAGAPAGAFVWRDTGKQRAIAVTSRGGEQSISNLTTGIEPIGDRPFLYDQALDRALTRDEDRNLRIAPAGPALHEAASALGLSSGLAVPIVNEAGDGQLYLEQVHGLSSDHLDLGRQIGAALSRQMHRRALMRAAEAQAEGRSRLAIARDLHDSVVQFLAGTAIRIEGMMRGNPDRDLKPELDELKQLMLQEQLELRSFITALRSGSQVEVAELAKDLQVLASRLSVQWDVQCTFSSDARAMPVPSRLQLDAQQLMREAVANAVRHAGAKNVSIRLEARGEDLHLEFINDGSAYPRRGDGGPIPKSMKERVEAAGGSLDISRGMGVTKLSLSLPAAGQAA